MNNTNVNNDSNGNSRTMTSADIPWVIKARYFGSGMVVGVLVAPLVKRVLAKAQPKLDSLLDSLTGQAEGIVEKGSDLMAKAKDILSQSEEKHQHTSSCTH